MISVAKLVSFVAARVVLVSSDCCMPYHHRPNLCDDGTIGTPCCGYGHCNIGCCNCDGGCRHGRYLLNDTSFDLHITKHEELPPSELVAQDVEVPLTSSACANQSIIISSNERLLNDNFHYDGTVRMDGISNIKHAEIVEAIYGCGGNHQTCGCEVIESAVHMHVYGTDGTATGFDFRCAFYVDSVRCELHVDIPYVGSNSIDCSCGTEGFQ